jgi:hypothetical protein
MLSKPDLRKKQLKEKALVEQRVKEMHEQKERDLQAKKMLEHIEKGRDDIK